MSDSVPSSPNPAPQTLCGHISVRVQLSHEKRVKSIALFNEEEVRWLTLQLLPSLDLEKPNMFNSLTICLIEQESTHTVNMAKSCIWPKERGRFYRDDFPFHDFHWLFFHLSVVPVPQTTSKKILCSLGNRQLLGQKDEILTISTTNLMHTNPNLVLLCQKVTLTARMVVLCPHPSCRSAANN